jgi:aconitase A
MQNVMLIQKNISIKLLKLIYTLEPHLNGPFTPDLATPISKLKEEAAKNGWPLKVKWV